MEKSFRSTSRIYTAHWPVERERLLRVLAYAREDTMGIPDGRLNSFTGDQREVRTASPDLAALLQAFKAWRLRFQMPAMWQEQDGMTRLLALRKLAENLL